MHKTWNKTGFLDKIKAQAAKRSQDNLTIGPIFTWTNDQIQGHVDEILSFPNTELLFGGKALKSNGVPEIYGTYPPTAVKVPITHFKNQKKREVLTRELFGPFQLVVEFGCT